jgi:hypothetical protein
VPVVWTVEAGEPGVCGEDGKGHWQGSVEK